MYVAQEDSTAEARASNTIHHHFTQCILYTTHNASPIHFQPISRNMHDVLYIHRSKCISHAFTTHLTAHTQCIGYTSNTMHPMHFQPISQVIHVTQVDSAKIRRGNERRLQLPATKNTEPPGTNYS